MVRRGFTLVEVLVALVLLEIGLLGVVGTLTLAARTLARAELREHAAAAVERVADSLVATGTTAGQGRVADPAGEVVWSAAAGKLRLVFAAPVDTAFLVIETLAGLAP